MSTGTSRSIVTAASAWELPQMRAAARATTRVKKRGMDRVSARRDPASIPQEGERTTPGGQPESLTLNRVVAGVGSAFPVGSIARTAKTCLPFLMCLNFAGEEQGANGRLSIWHSKAEPGSEDENEKL